MVVRTPDSSASIFRVKTFFVQYLSLNFYAIFLFFTIVIFSSIQNCKIIRCTLLTSSAIHHVIVMYVYLCARSHFLSRNSVKLDENNFLINREISFFFWHTMCIVTLGLRPRVTIYTSSAYKGIYHSAAYKTIVTEFVTELRLHYFVP